MESASKLPKVGVTIFTVMSQLAAEHGAINLGQGFPDFSVPGPLVDALQRAMLEGRNQYAPMAGIPELRQAIAGKIADCYGCEVDPDRQITVTSGGSEAIFDVVHAVVTAGDEVVMLDPCYDCYEPAVLLAGGVPVHVSLDPASFAVDWAAVESAITSRTRLLFINTPHNPSGAILESEDMQRLRDLLAAHPRLLILSDEVYEHMVFDARQHESVLRDPVLAARSFAVSSFGKTYHCTGWKLGYCVAPAELTAEFRKVHQYNTFCSFTPAQYAVAEMIRRHPEHHRELPAFYQAKRDRFREQLLGTRLKPLPVPGGYFQLVDYSAVSDLDDTAFCRWLTTEHKVAAIPLSPFYAQAPQGQRLARLCFAKNSDTLDTAIERLKRL
ncbi:pyridoxal phosphate-dependent aminotransferase [Pseudomarimonas arenosa]|uniref:Pyridoxal phosphate-dependent aminotransferase n=1 Tax=Pseudomarimonas arenosa TaxID=2774145 RepID=A0AAW3ZJX6_9GAMM|nr:pyridoxal phosphate-dependent aminotransferase [Pseudomarimonas arenosa]MBD8525332.1 pyridoxal phosphate-dependent aminotransferase [Pseudomarimonas arenosa]